MGRGAETQVAETARRAEEAIKAGGGDFSAKEEAQAAPGSKEKEAATPAGSGCCELVGAKYDSEVSEPRAALADIWQDLPVLTCLRAATHQLTRACGVSQL